MEIKNLKAILNANAYQFTKIEDVSDSMPICTTIIIPTSKLLFGKKQWEITFLLYAAYFYF